MRQTPVGYGACWDAPALAELLLAQRGRSGVCGLYLTWVRTIISENSCLGKAEPGRNGRTRECLTPSKRLWSLGASLEPTLVRLIADHARELSRSALLRGQASAGMELGVVCTQDGQVAAVRLPVRTFCPAGRTAHGAKTP